MTIDRRALRVVLTERYPFVSDPEVGPSTVEAGECDRCGRSPRVVATCGPVSWEALCVSCATAVSETGWCDGHEDEAARWRDRMSTWPPEHETVARLWWVATGEVGLETLVRPAAAIEALPADVRVLLDGRG